MNFKFLGVNLNPPPQEFKNIDELFLFKNLNIDDLVIIKNL